MISDKVGLVLLSGLAAFWGCAADAERVSQDVEPLSSLTVAIEVLETRSVHFRLALSQEAEGTIYVSLNGTDGQPGWLRVSREGERVYLKPRCEIEDCAEAPMVCGAAIPMIQALRAGQGPDSLGFTWDGEESVVLSDRSCELRQPAEAGAYTARFCVSRDGAYEQPADLSQPVPGQVIAPECLERAFTLPQLDRPRGFSQEALRHGDAAPW